MSSTTFDSKLLVIKKLAEHGQLALQAAQETADKTVRLHVDRMRQLRALLQRKDLLELDASESLDASTVEMLSLAQADIARADRFIDVWTKRYLQIFPRATLLTSTEGCHAVLDAELSATWDWDHDLLACVIDSQDHPLIQALQERNQKRLMIIKQGNGTWTRPLPPQWRVFQTGDSLSYEAWTSPPISHVSIIDTLLTPASNDLIQLLRMGLMSHLTNVATFRTFGERWLKQGLENLASVARYPSWAAFKSVSENRPAVIVSPGPSLQKNLHLLKSVQDQVVIIATAQAIMALQANGIVPHVIVVADPQDMSHYFSGYVFRRQTVLAIGRSCGPGLFQLPAHHFTTHPVSRLTDGWINKILKDEQFLDSGGSVAITALSMALQWSCKSIALIGQDLAFDGNRQYAADTADADLLWDFANHQGGGLRPIQIPDGIKNMHKQSGGIAEDVDKPVQIMELPGYHGGTVYTKIDYFVFHGHFERIAHESNKSLGANPSLYNCTEGGARIAGYEQCSLHNWLVQFVETQSPLEWEEGVRAIESIHLQNNNAVNQLQAWKKQTISALKSCSQAAQAAQKIFSGTWTAHKSQQLKLYENELLDTLDHLEFISIAHQQSIYDALASINLAHDHYSAMRAEQELVGIIKMAIENFIPLVEAVPDYPVESGIQ